jgi:hypothetical protein
VSGRSTHLCCVETLARQAKAIPDAAVNNLVDGPSCSCLQAHPCSERGDLFSRRFEEEEEILVAKDGLTGGCHPRKL